MADYLQKKDIPVDEEAVRSLALRGKLPCFFFDENPEPLFLCPDIDEWICKKMMRQSPATPAELALESSLAVAGETPEALRTIEDLHFLPLELDSSVVYFLCQDSKVVYVGRSLRLSGRIGEHLRGEKKFNRVFFICVPADQTGKWEAYFIRALQPVYNLDQASLDEEKKVVAVEPQSSNTTTCSASS